MINIISAISVAGLMIGTMGLIIGLSGFNGFDSLIKSLFSSFDPELKITIVEGKSFSTRGDLFDKIRNMSEIVNYAEVIEENALVKNGERHIFATVKGVNPDYQLVTGIDTMITEGKYLLKDKVNQYAVLGQSIAYDLTVGINQMEPISIYVPKKGREISVIPGSNFNQKMIYPSGIFSIQQEIDSKYIIVPIDFARDLFELPEKVSAIELKLTKGVSVEKVQFIIAGLLGKEYAVKTRYQQHDYLYKTMQSEKFATYLILILILVIASFNIIGSLTMLILDKKEDIAILRSMGADRFMIRKIFLFEGWSISLLGALLGTLAGIAICQAQITYGFVKLQGGASFIIDAYPMKIIPLDILIIVISVIFIGFIAAWFPIRYISEKLISDEAH